MKSSRPCGSTNTQNGQPCQNFRDSCPHPSHKHSNSRSVLPQQAEISQDLDSFWPTEPLHQGVRQGSRGLAGVPELFDDLVLATERRTGMLPNQITKEYWLSCAVYAIATNPQSRNVYNTRTGDLIGVTAFAGGSSLVSGWQILQRHSEDVDIVVFAGSDDVSNSGVGRALKKALLPAYQYLLPVTGKPRKEPMRKLGYRNLVFPMLPDEEEYLKTEATFEAPAYDLPLCSERTIISSMGKAASPSLIAKYPELGGFKMLCITPAYTAANKLDALHRRSHTGDYQGLFDRSRDLYDTAMIAKTSHGLQVPELLERLQYRLARPWSTRAVYGRPPRGYSSSPAFQPRTRAYEAIKEGYEHLLPSLVWGEMPTFKEAIELTLTLDP